jgi:hypothetical protein
VEQTHIRWQEPESNCPTCGYNLRGLATTQCPECGSQFDPRELQSRVPTIVGSVASAGSLLIVVIVASHAMSWVIQRVGWPATRGPRAREWIVHDGNVSQVPLYIPITVWLPMCAAAVALLVVGIWLKRQLDRVNRDSDPIIAGFGVIAVGLLGLSYGCMNWTALCCD